MTEHEQHEQHELHELDVLDFPGADRLRAAGDVAPPSPAVVSAALTAVRAAAADSATVVPFGSRPRHRGRRILVSAAAVAAVTAGAAVYPTIGVGDNPPAASADAAGFLHRMADTAGAEPVSGARYWKVETRTSVTSPAPGGVPGTRTRTETATEWLSRNSFLRASSGDGEVMEFTGLANGWALSPDGGARSTTGYRLAQPGRHELTSWNVGGLPPARGRAITWDDLKTLPTEPKALRARLLDGSGGTGADEQLFNGIEALLADAPAGPRLRAALFEVLAAIPHVRLAGSVRDSAGRGGTAVELKSGYGSSRMIIDPETSELLEARTVARSNAESDAGTVRTTYLSAGPSEDAPRPHSRSETPAAKASPRSDG
ncbi:CU044_5270 family protein [Streptomyces sp. NPDC056683]|uniref:CU044_5270 family protein n=1 Tax=Streptomyces sp. NPDC056683 TaxID=3345910 RepID=UPI00368B89D8